MFRPCTSFQWVKPSVKTVKKSSGALNQTVKHSPRTTRNTAALATHVYAGTLRTTCTVGRFHARAGVA